MRRHHPALALAFCALPLLAIEPRVTFSQSPSPAPSPTPAMPTGGEVAAQSAADVWLAINDDCRYDASYKAAASAFQGRISQVDWEKKVTAGRGALGKLSQRKHLDSKFYPTLPGAPDGQYVVVRYESSFEKKASAIETVTMTVDNDGGWKACGYFIR